MTLPSDPAAAASPQPKRFFWEDFPVGQVREFGAYRVTREAVLAFAREFDPQPFHLDDAAAEASLFGRLAASGWHTCAMAMRMMCDAYLLESASLGSPGLEKLNWTRPVYPATPSMSGSKWWSRAAWRAAPTSASSVRAGT